jgi:hypothetical protein
LPFTAANYNGEFVLHQDNAPKHTSITCKNFDKFNNIHWMKSPPQSPDLNPIELVWHELKNYIRIY